MYTYVHVYLSLSLSLSVCLGVQIKLDPDLHELLGQTQFGFALAWIRERQRHADHAVAVLLKVRRPRAHLPHSCTHTHTQISKHIPVVTIARSSTRTHADATLHPQGRTNERAAYVCLCICMSISLSLCVYVAMAVRWDGSRSFARRSSSCMRMARRPCLPVWSAWPRSTSRRSASSSAASRPSPVRCACLHSPHHT
jgi:hypothetical protein